MDRNLGVTSYHYLRPEFGRLVWEKIFIREVLRAAHCKSLFSGVFIQKHWI